MKKILTFLLILMMGQYVYAKKFTLGVTANSTSPSVTSETDTVSGNGMGLGGGFLFDFSIKKLPRIEMGALMLSRKLLIKNTADLDVSMSLIQLPMMFKKTFGKKKIKFELGLGGYYEIASGSITETNIETKVSETYSPGSWQIGTSDYGAMLSLGLVWTLKKSELLFDIRHSSGLKDVSLYETATWKFSDTYLLLGWRFGK